MQEANVRIPEELKPYIDLQEGKLVEIAEPPEALKEELQSFIEYWERIHSLEDLTEYRKAMLRITKQYTVLVSLDQWEEHAGRGQWIEVYILEDGTEVIRDTETLFFLDAGGTLYDPVGNPLKGFEIIGETTRPATIQEQDIFYQVSSKLRGEK